MRFMAALALAGAMAITAQGASAQTQPAQQQQQQSTIVRGVVTAVTDSSVDIKLADGSTTTLRVRDKTDYFLVSPLKIDDVKQGVYVSATGQPSGSGVAAVTITVYPDKLKGFGEGQQKSTAAPATTVTNGTVTAVTPAPARSITVTYKGTAQVLTTADDTEVITFEVVDKSVVKVGTAVLANVRSRGNGQSTVIYFSVGKDGYVIK